MLKATSTENFATFRSSELLFIFYLLLSVPINKCFMDFSACNIQFG